MAQEIMQAKGANKLQEMGKLEEALALIAMSVPKLLETLKAAVDNLAKYTYALKRFRALLNEKKCLIAACDNPREVLQIAKQLGKVAELLIDLQLAVDKAAKAHAVALVSWQAAEDKRTKMEADLAALQADLGEFIVLEFFMQIVNEHNLTLPAQGGVAAQGGGARP